MAQKNAPLRLSLRRGRADGLGADAGRRRGAASRCRCRSRASRSRSASTRSSCATAWRASTADDVVLKLISPLRPGLIEAADEQRLPLPDHADPAQRLRPSVDAIARLRLRDFRTYERRRRAARARADGRARAQRRRQDEPARGAVLRLHRALVPDDRTSARSCASARRRARVEVDGRDARRRARAGVGLRAGRAEAPEGRRGAGRAAAGRPARPLVSVFLPDRLELVKGAPALRRSHLDQVVAALWPARRRDAQRVPRGAGPAQRAAGADPRRPRRRAPSLPAWDARARPPRRRADATTARRALELLGRALRRARRASSGSPARRELRYRPRSQAADAEALAAELAERVELGPRARLHRPRPAPRRPRAPARRARAARVRLAGRAAPGAAGAAAGRARGARRERGAPPLMLLDDVMSELDAGRRSALVERARRAGQSVVTTTDLAHVPGADGAGVVRLASRVEDATRAPRGRARHEPPRAARRGAGRRRADRSARAADAARPRSSACGATAVGDGRRRAGEADRRARRGAHGHLPSAVWAQELDLMGRSWSSASTPRSAPRP